MVVKVSNRIQPHNKNLSAYERQIEIRIMQMKNKHKISRSKGNTYPVWHHIDFENPHGAHGIHHNE
jgi:hypothetical protein